MAPSTSTVMATDKRLVQAASLADKDYDGSSSLAIQLPTTSANSNDDINGASNGHPNHNNNHHSRLLNNRIIDYNNNPNNRSTTINSHQSNSNHKHILNYCHHEAATRSLLFNRHNSSDLFTSTGTTTNTTDTTRTESEESVTPPPHYHEIPGIVPAYQGRTSGPPPAYDDVVNPYAPPPTYNSLYGQVREARKTSNGLVDLLRQLFLILIGTIGCTMIIGFLLLIPITMILVGIFYVNECRAENIPSFLVIGGFVWIIKNVLNCYNQFKKDSSTSNRPPPRRRAPISTSSGYSTASSATGASGSPATSTSSETSSSSSVLIVSGQTQQISSHDMNQNANVLAITSHTNNYNQSDLAASQATLPATITTTTPTSATQTMAPTTRTRPMRDQNNPNHIRHPPMIGLTSYKCESMLNYFLIVWFLAGCIVVYRIYEPDYENPLSASYCNRTVYMYAFWLMTSAFIIMAIVLSCLCCLMASSLMSCNHGR